MRQDYLAEDNAIAREFFNRLSSDARNALTVEDICVLVGLAAESRERAVRAELTAPAGGDVETADKLVRRFYKIPDGEELADWAYKLRNEITAVLYIARQAERSKVPPPDEIHRDGYNEGVMAERERWEAAAGEYLDAEDKEFGLEIQTEPKVTQPEKNKAHNSVVLARDALVALVRCEGKGEEAERETD